ncbi:MAG TPA: DUF4157 domain-containing protein [Allosphingosinicella sp.]|nr:DUF4157 domain-containing protein [Allosphingosinicella sp.]
MRMFEPMKPPTRRAPVPLQAPRPAPRRPASAFAHHPSGSPLTIGRSGLHSEREARQIADQAVSGGASPPVPVTGRAEGDGEQAPPIVDRVLGREGHPLEQGARRLMEAGLGADLGGVRIHDDGLAAESARAVGARAYAVGETIVFGAGEYAPHEPKGRWLLAHELAHTLQPGAESVVQRYESFEHVFIGDTAPGDGGKRILLKCHEFDFPAKERTKPFDEWPKLWRERYIGYKHEQRLALQLGLTYGEIVALVGDLYASFEDLTNAPLKEVMDLIPLIRGEKTTTAEFQAATAGRYGDLAVKNVSHFSGVPTQKNKDVWKKKRGVGISSNMEVWGEQHRAAIAYARQGLADLAWGTNAGADHFLSDAFSAGHIRTPRADLIGGGLTGKAKDVKSKVLHDLDNAYGVEVVNARGEKWLAFGDNYLDPDDKDPKYAAGRMMVLRAIALSKQDIADALAMGKAYPDPSTITGFEAEQLVPHAVNPAKDRWTGRPPETNPFVDEGPAWKMDTDYSTMESQITSKEGPNAIKEKLLTEDNLIIDWISSIPMNALARINVFEKIRMLNILVSGSIDPFDMAAIEKILGSVPSEFEMKIISTEFPDAWIVNVDAKKRIREALDRFAPKNYPPEKPDRSSLPFSRPPRTSVLPHETPSWPPR